MWARHVKLSMSKPAKNIKFWHWLLYATLPRRVNVIPPHSGVVSAFQLSQKHPNPRGSGCYWFPFKPHETDYHLWSNGAIYSRGRGHSAELDTIFWFALNVFGCFQTFSKGPWNLPCPIFYYTNREQTASNQKKREPKVKLHCNLYKNTHVSSWTILELFC